MDIGASCYLRYIEGDDSAFEELVAMFAPGLILFINGFVHCPATAEDLMEDTFCELILHKNRNKNHFRGGSAFKTYLYSIARHKAITCIRKNKEMTFLVAAEPVADVDLDDVVWRHDRDQRLYDALDKIRAEYREALYLFYFDDMDYEQIAAVLKKNKGQVKNLLHRGKQSLRELLAYEGLD